MVRRPPARTRTFDNVTTATTPISTPTAAVVEAQLAKLQSQLGELKAQVRQAQQLASLGTAAAMIAHEVNNLLTPVQSYAQAALAGNDADLREKALRTALKNVKLLVAMSERVLQISAAKPPERQAVGVRAAAEDAVASLCRDLSKDGITLTVNVNDSLTVWADPLQLHQVFFNLFLNARNVMAPSHNGRLTVSARPEGDEVVIVVKDSGPGIPTNLLPHIFDPLQTSKPMEPNGRQRCAGLGLALCRDLVQENGGTISVTSEPGVGTTFTITLSASES